MAQSVKSSQADVQESVWIEIIRHMESLYGELAEAQAEVERRAQELSEAKKLTDNVLRSMNDALVVLDSAGRVSMVNHAAEKLFRLREERLLGKEVTVLFAPGSRARWRWSVLRREMQREGWPAEVETHCVDATGAGIPCGVSGAPLQDGWGDIIGAVLVVRDLREAKRRIAEARKATQAATAKARELEKANQEMKLLQAELVQAAKMSSLGQLAAGVAHELNNPLGSILLYSDLILEETPQDDPRRQNLQKVARQAARCREIVRGLLDFARQPQARLSSVDVNALLSETMDVLRGQEMFHNVELVWQLQNDLPPLTADRAQLQQAFTNILLNAVEAMQGRGTLTVATAAEPGGKGVTVRFTDTGCGIPQEDHNRLFEPFFTTRETGTGLGLAVTYGIVERHGGSIEVRSEVGRGTTFVLHLRSMREGGGGD